LLLVWPIFSIRFFLIDSQIRGILIVIFSEKRTFLDKKLIQ
jgi:hypothetical protein